MENKILFEYEKGLDSLRDLQDLGDQSLFSVIDRCHYHFGEIRREAEKKINTLESFSKLGSFLEDTFTTLIENFVRDTLGRNQLIMQRDFSNIGVEKWNLLLEVTPVFLKVCSLFPFKGSINVQITNNQLKLRGLVSTEAEFAKYRKLIYSATRKLIGHKCLLTYNVSKGNGKGLEWLELNLDIGHDDASVYLMDLSETIGSRLGFSNILSNYSLPENKIEGLGRHLIIEITDRLEVNKMYRIPDRYSRDLEGKDLLHFSFLFRPVSIIIPNKGMVSSISKIFITEDTGSGFQIDQQEVEKRQKSHYRLIDFFSLIVD